MRLHPTDPRGSDPRSKSALRLVVEQGTAPNVFVLGAGVVISALANAPYNISVSSLYMSRILAHYLGRVEGIDTMIDNFVNLLGFVAASLAVLWWSPRAVFLISAIAIVPSLIVALTQVARKAPVAVPPLDTTKID